MSVGCGVDNMFGKLITHINKLDISKWKKLFEMNQLTIYGRTVAGNIPARKAFLFKIKNSVPGIPNLALSINY